MSAVIYQYWMTQKISVPTTRCLLMPLSPVPMPWHSRPSSLQYYSFQLFWYLVWFCSWRYSSESHVSVFSTGMDRYVTGLYQRASRALVKYRWGAWYDMTRRACVNYMDRSTGGCAFCVWDLVRNTMVWSGSISLGCILGGGGSGNLCGFFTLLAVSHCAGLLRTLGVGQGGMVCCSLGYFSILFLTLIYWRVWSVSGNGIGDRVSSGDSQLVEASRRSIMAWSWAYDWSVGASVRSSVSMLSPWRIRYYGVTTWGSYGLVEELHSIVDLICLGVV